MKNVHEFVIRKAEEGRESAKKIQRWHDVVVDHKDMLFWDLDTIGRYQYRVQWCAVRNKGT